MHRFLNNQETVDTNHITPVSPLRIGEQHHRGRNKDVFRPLLIGELVGYTRGERRRDRDSNPQGARQDDLRNLKSAAVPVLASLSNSRRRQTEQDPMGIRRATKAKRVYAASPNRLDLHKADWLTPVHRAVTPPERNRHRLPAACPQSRISNPPPEPAQSASGRMDPDDAIPSRPNSLFAEPSAVTSQTIPHPVAPRIRPATPVSRGSA